MSATEWLHGDDVREAVAALLFKGDPSMDEATERKEWAWARREADNLLCNARRHRDHPPEPDPPRAA